MDFYGTAYYLWPYARVAVRNIASGPTAVIMGDGIKGWAEFGHWVLTRVCPFRWPGENCPTSGTRAWVSSMPAVTVGQWVYRGDLWNEFLRTIRSETGE